MAFKTTKYFVLISALVIAGTRYMNLNRDRINLNNNVGIWDTEAKDGLRYTVVRRSNETDGKFFVVHAVCTPKAQGFYPGKPCSPPQHFHDTQDEEFEAVSGVLALDWNGTAVHLPVGQKKTVPAGLPHTFWNNGSEPLELYIRMSPGVPDEGFLEMVAALSQQVGSLSKVSPLQLLLLFSDYGITLTEIPEPLWKAAKAFLVPLARIMGFRSHYAAYVSKSGQPLPIELPNPDQVPAGGQSGPQQAVKPAPAPEQPAETLTAGDVSEEAVVAEVTEVTAVTENPDEKTEL